MFGPGDDNTDYQNRRLFIAYAIRKIIEDRADSANDRINDGDIIRMTQGMNLEGVSFPDFSGSDIERLTPVQVYWLQNYKFRENELNAFIEWYGFNKENYSDEKAVKSFMHRLNRLRETVADLIQNWHANALA